MPAASDPAHVLVFLAPSHAFVVLAAQRAVHGPARQTLPQVVAGTRSAERHGTTGDERR
jgi:hypothetical protein